MSDCIRNAGEVLKKSRALGRTLIRVAWLLVSACAFSAQAHAVTYFVSPGGSDAADGLTRETAWASLAKVSATSFAPGSEILLQRGGEWRGQLLASSSGAPGQPIVYGAYGDGAKPRIIGSDILDKQAFSLTSGTMYELAAPQPIGSVLGDGAFLTNAWLVGGRTTDATANRYYVETHPNSYFYDALGQRLYLNVGQHPASDARQFTAVTRDDLVSSNAKSHLAFRDIITDESAIFDRGYGFKFGEGSDVKCFDCEAYRAGKHHFGAINVTEFLGQGIKAAIAMPDQGVGGATALVSFASANHPGQVTTWRDVEVRDMGELYPAWLSHGEGVESITLENMRSYGAEVSIGERTTATDIYVEGAGVDIGAGSTLDRSHLVGANSSLRFWGAAAATNVWIDGFHRTRGPASPIVVFGENNSLSSSTITMGAGQVDQVITYSRGTGHVDLTGNVISNLAAAQPNISTLETLSSENYGGDFNVWHNVRFRLGWGSTPTLTFAEWQALTAADDNSIVGDPQFVDVAGDDFHLLGAGSNLVPLSELDSMSGVDFNGIPRSLGVMADAGAFETPNISADVNADGQVDGADFLAWQRAEADPSGLAAWRAQFGNEAGEVQVIPEPASWILAIGLAALFFREL
jgi:hypothetical protein